MPTYQYACTECGEPLEVVQSFTDDALTECPSCGGRLRKLFNAVGIVFKGSGFYRNDSRAGAGAGAASGSKADGAAGGASKAGGDKTATSDGSGGSSTSSTSSASDGSGGSKGDSGSSGTAKSGSGSSGTSAA